MTFSRKALLVVLALTPTFGAVAACGARTELAQGQHTPDAALPDAEAPRHESPRTGVVWLAFTFHSGRVCS